MSGRMSRQERLILLGHTPDRAARPAAALVVGGELEDLVVDPPAGCTRPRVGEIHGARVVRKGAKAAGAFLDLGAGRTGFLRDGREVREGEALAVQVSGQPEPGKAVPVTTRLLHKRRLLILTPGAPGINVSRQVDGAERARLEAAVTAAAAPFLDAHAAGLDAADDTPAGRRRALMAERGRLMAESGVIVRTAAEGAPPGVLAASLEALLAERAEVAARLATGARDGPWTAADAWTLALRDWCAPAPDRILADEGALAAARASDEMADPALADRLRPAGGDPFDQIGLWERIDALLDAEVALPGGGSMLVEATAALVAVDVNTGGDFAPDAGLRANLAAVRLLMRELRLRGLGGQVVVDFAPMAKKDRRRLEEAMKSALRHDTIETIAHGWTTMGLYELQRKRERRPLTA